MKHLFTATLLATTLAQAEPVTLATPSGTLHGTLTVPGEPARPPLVLLHPGSGPTDRDGASPLLPGQVGSLKLLAEALAARGVATLRVDKRGIGQSAAAAPTEAELRFGTYVDDAAGWLRQYAGDRRFCAVLAGGHSEGAQIAVRAAEAGSAQGVVLLAGAGRPALAVVRAQLQPQLPAELYAQADAALTRIAAGEVGQPTPPGLAALLRPSVQPYLASWLALDPAADLARWRGPALAVWGEADAQVSEADFTALAEARPGVQTLRVKGMDHVLKVGGELAPQVAAAVEGFAKGVCRP